MKDDKEHLELIESLFLKMGASGEQARTMASQLLKRAQQIAEEQGIGLVEAVEILLNKVIEARKN